MSIALIACLKSNQMGMLHILHPKNDDARQIYEPVKFVEHFANDSVSNKSVAGNENLSFICVMISKMVFLTFLIKETSRMKLLPSMLLYKGLKQNEIRSPST